jgi:anionic cell wall polymer biosynthesis LytR-Cps2A-Psr (LCP) family protein
VFDLDIQRFVIVNFEGTQNLVDACGGVDMRLTDTGPDGRTNEVFYIEAYGGKAIKNPDGTYHLDGKSALIHMRHRWGSSDYKRTERQRNVIMALFRQVVSSRDLSEIYGIVRQGFGMIATNIPLSEMIDLAASVVGNGANMSISSQRISGSYATFIIGEQRYANPGESGASIISINQTYMASEISKWIYGK